MSVHVRYETPEDVSNKIYELVQACNGGRIKRIERSDQSRSPQDGGLRRARRGRQSPSSSTTSRSFVTTTASPSATSPLRNSWPRKQAWKPV